MNINQLLARSRRTTEVEAHHSAESSAADDATVSMPDRLYRIDELITDTLVISFTSIEPNDTKRAYPGGDVTAGLIGRSSVCTTRSADTISPTGRARNREIRSCRCSRLRGTGLWSAAILGVG